MFISELRENASSLGLPMRFVDTLPEFCQSCGCELEIRESLTGLCCSNPRCSDKMIMRIRAICKDLGILYFGESAIEKFVELHRPDAPVDIFFLRKGMPIGEGISQKVADTIIEQIDGKRDMLLWEYVMYDNIPGVRTSAQKIFSGYHTLEEAYKDIEEGGLPFIQKKLGMSSQYAYVQAVKVYNNLLEFKSDLFGAIGEVRITNLDGVKEFNVVCSDQVGGGFNTKSEFYSYVNNRFSGSIHVNFLPSVNKSIDFLVWAGADGSPARYTSKVQKVEGFNAKGCNIPIVTALQFIEILENGV